MRSLAGEFDQHQTTISLHLRLLREAGHRNANVATAGPTAGPHTTPWPSSADLVLGGDDPNASAIPNPVPGIRHPASGWSLGPSRRALRGN